MLSTYDLMLEVVNALKDNVISDDLIKRVHKCSLHLSRYSPDIEDVRECLGWTRVAGALERRARGDNHTALEMLRHAREDFVVAANGLCEVAKLIDQVIGGANVG